MKIQVLQKSNKIRTPTTKSNNLDIDEMNLKTKLATSLRRQKENYWIRELGTATLDGCRYRY